MVLFQGIMKLKAKFLDFLGDFPYNAISFFWAPVAQLDRVLDYESSGRRFDSFPARHFFSTLCVFLRIPRTGCTLKIFAAFRIVALLTALIGVIAIIKGIGPHHVQNFFGAFTGDPAALETMRPVAVSPRKEKFNLCKTRVHAIIWPDGRKIEEFKQGFTMKWLAFDPQPREIGYLDIEKWLGEHCRFDVQAPSPEVSAEAAFANEITVEFIDKSTIRIAQAPGDLFRIDDRIIHSPEFAQALNELRGLAQFDEKH